MSRDAELLADQLARTIGSIRSMLHLLGSTSFALTLTIRDGQFLRLQSDIADEAEALLHEIRTRGE